MEYREGLAMRGDGIPSVTSLGDKDQLELLYRLNYRDTCAPTCEERDLLGFLPQPAYSAWPAGFLSNCFYSSKVFRFSFLCSNDLPNLGLNPV